MQIHFKAGDKYIHLSVEWVQHMKIPPIVHVESFRLWFFYNLAADRKAGVGKVIMREESILIQVSIEVCIGKILVVLLYPDTGVMIGYIRKYKPDNISISL